MVRHSDANAIARVTYIAEQASAATMSWAAPPGTSRLKVAMPMATRMSCWHTVTASIGMALPATMWIVRIGAMRSRSQVPHPCSRKNENPIDPVPMSVNSETRAGTE